MFLADREPRHLGSRQALNLTWFREEGLKKNPQPSHGRLGILPAFTLHSLILEDHGVKNIRQVF